MLAYLDKIAICSLYDKKLDKLQKPPIGIIKGNEEKREIVSRFESSIIKDSSLILDVPEQEIIEFLENPGFTPSLTVSSCFSSLSQTILTLDTQEKYTLIPLSKNHFEEHPDNRYYKFIQIQKIKLEEGKDLINERLIVVSETELEEAGYYRLVAYNIAKFKKEHPELDSETLAIARARRELWKEIHNNYQRYAPIKDEVIEDWSAYTKSFFERYAKDFYEIHENQECTWNNIRRIYDNRKVENNHTEQVVESYKLSLKN